MKKFLLLLTLISNTVIAGGHHHYDCSFLEIEIHNNTFDTCVLTNVDYSWSMPLVTMPDEIASGKTGTAVVRQNIFFGASSTFTFMCGKHHATVTSSQTPCIFKAGGISVKTGKHDRLALSYGAYPPHFETQDSIVDSQMGMVKWYIANTSQ